MKKLLYAIIAVVVFSIAAFFACHWILDNKVSNFIGRADIYVYDDSSVDDVMAQLSSSLQIKHPESLERVFESKEVARYLHPGHYVVCEGQSSAYVARMLNNGWQTPVNLVLSGNLRLRGNIAQKIASQMMLDSATVRNSFEDREFLRKYGFTPETVFALFIPDTYEIYWDASLEDLYDCQKRSYDSFWNTERKAKADALGLTPLQVDILASIVRGESRYAPELPKIAGVYLNRLKRGMKLQADPTVVFCFDYTLNRVLHKHLAVDSPYNTYKHAGLPPGPICIAPGDYIDAVLNPDYGDGNLFFCANYDFSGSHLFAATLREHTANAKAFQAELNRRNAEKKRSEQNK